MAHAPCILTQEASALGVCGCQLLIRLLQLLVREAAILNIFKIDFVVSEDVECQTGSLKQFGMGCVIHSNLWKPATHSLFFSY